MKGTPVERAAVFWFTKGLSPEAQANILAEPNTWHPGLARLAKSVARMLKAQQKPSKKMPKARDCPKCKRRLPISDFGVRVMGGKARPQSWCTRCRSKS